MADPRVSVVMSVFNGERFLREAVDSILQQSFHDFEFIVIDDGSTDGSPGILDSFQAADPRVRVYRQENRGLVDSLNRGWDLAQGAYIARMDADDIAVPDRLSWQVDFMERHPDIALVGGAIECIDGTGKSLVINRFPITDREIKPALLRGSVGFCHPAVLVRRDVVASVGGYRKVVVHAEDYDLWLRIADRFKLANLKAVVLKYRLHTQSVSARMVRQMALSGLGARLAAHSRRNGNPDPLDSISEITPETLVKLGVSEAGVRTGLAKGYLTSIRNMSYAGEAAVEPYALIQMRRSDDFKSVESSVAADFLLFAAQLYWRQKRFVKSFFTVGYAVITRPIMLGRPIKPLLRRFRLI